MPKSKDKSPSVSKKIPQRSDWIQANTVISNIIDELKTWTGSRNLSRAISSLEDAQDKVNRHMMVDLKKFLSSN
jgi:hypothetical protein